MNASKQFDLVKYVLARTVAFVGLTTITTVVMALPYISSN
jgi:hypothetical protein